MKQKILGLIAMMILAVPSVYAADESEGIALNDTMVFTLFVVAAIVFMMIIYAQVNAVRGLLDNRDLWTKGGDKKSSGNGKKATAVIALIMATQATYAQDGGGEPLVAMTDQLYWILIALNAFLLGIIISLHYVLRGLIRNLMGQEEEEVDAIASLTKSLTDAVPIEQEGEIMMDHDYDGIRELDNNLPPWWKYGFYFTILFAVVYLINYHVLGTGKLQLEEYQEQVAEAEAAMADFMAEQASVVDEANLVALTESGRLEAGKAIYVGNCQVCHGANLEGVVGPNLTDEYWKHGGGITNVYNVIKNGVVEKGMISWSSQLTPGQMLEVSSYILSMQGSNPPNAKAPEGEIWVEEAAPAEAEETEEGSEEAAEETMVESEETEV